MTEGAPTVVMAQLEVEGCTAELFVNRIPVVRLRPGYGPIENNAVEQMLVPGENRLEVLVEPGPRPTSAWSVERQLDYQPMKVVGRLIRFPAGVPGFVKYGDLLAEAAFTWDEGGPLHQTFPIVATATAQLGTAHGRWGWQDAPVLSASTELNDEACVLLDELAHVIRNKDAAGLERMVTHKTQDMARAYPALTPAVMSQQIAEGIRHLEPLDDPIVARDRNNHDFRLVAEGRMLEIVDTSYAPSFGVRNPDSLNPQPYRMMLSRVNGALRIVR